MPSEDWPQDAAMYGLLEEWWSKHFNAKQLTELKTELQTMPKAGNDERWGYVRAQLGLADSGEHAGETFVTAN
jgi:hypothetical protein